MPNQFQNVAFPLSHQMEDTYKPVIESKNLKNKIKIRLSVGQKQKKLFFLCNDQNPQSYVLSYKIRCTLYFG